MDKKTISLNFNELNQVNINMYKNEIDNKHLEKNL